MIRQSCFLLVNNIKYKSCSTRLCVLSDLFGANLLPMGKLEKITAAIDASGVRPS